MTVEVFVAGRTLTADGERELEGGADRPERYINASAEAVVC